MSQCNSEVIREPQLTNTDRHDEKKNKYIKWKKKYCENNQIEKLEELGQHHQTILQGYKHALKGLQTETHNMQKQEWRYYC
jgi:hypothetical protein